MIARPPKPLIFKGFGGLFTTRDHSLTTDTFLELPLVVSCGYLQIKFQGVKLSDGLLVLTCALSKQQRMEAYDMNADTKSEIMNLLLEIAIDPENDAELARGYFILCLINCYCSGN